MGMTLPGESVLTCGRVSIRANRLQGHSTGQARHRRAGHVVFFLISMLPHSMWNGAPEWQRKCNDEGVSHGRGQGPAQAGCWVTSWGGLSEGAEDVEGRGHGSCRKVSGVWGPAARQATPLCFAPAWRVRCVP